jgi:hypothetical protein
MRYTHWLVVILLTLPAAAWADSADDDWSDDDDDTWDPQAFCEDFCDRMENCGAECITDTCAGDCVANLPDTVNCSYVSDCSDFGLCACDVLATQSPGNDDDDNDADGCGGCDVAGADTGAALSTLMMAIGLAALVISRRERKS